MVLDIVVESKTLRRTNPWRVEGRPDMWRPSWSSRTLTWSDGGKSLHALHLPPERWNPHRTEFKVEGIIHSILIPSRDHPAERALDGTSISVQ
jgi:hypothetical protein